MERQGIWRIVIGIIIALCACRAITDGPYAIAATVVVLIGIAIAIWGALAHGRPK